MMIVRGAPEKACILCAPNFLQAPDAAIEPRCLFEIADGDVHAADASNMRQVSYFSACDRTRRRGAGGVSGTSTPNFAGDLCNHTQLVPLLLFCKDIALLGRCKSALR